MNPLTQSKNATILPVLIALMLGCFGLSPAPKAFGVLPAPDGGYPNQNTAEGEDAVLRLNTPANGTWTATGSLGTARDEHTATLLQNGMVLVAGGIGSLGVHLTSAELYDPASGTWTATGSLGTARHEHTATLLPNGKVLVAGGYNGPISPSAREPLILLPLLLRAPRTPR
jgi:Galactose oxidase, central domain